MSAGREAPRAAGRQAPGAARREASMGPRRVAPTGPRLRVNPIACEAHGLCAEILPELIRLDDWGYPIIEQAEVPLELLALAERAADACPTLALLLEDDGPER